MCKHWLQKVRLADEASALAHQLEIRLIPPERERQQGTSPASQHSRTRFWRVG